MYYLVTGDLNSGKTEFLLDSMKKYKNNLFITNDDSVIYIQRRMSSMHVCGACVGVSSLGQFCTSLCGVPAGRIISKEESLLYIAQIIDDNRNALKAFGKVTIDSQDIKDIYQVITAIEYQEDGLKYIKNKIDAKTVYYEDVDKLKDIIFIYEQYISILESQGLNSITGAFNKSTSYISIHPEIFKFDHIIIDSLEFYPPLIANLLTLAVSNDKLDISIAFLTKENYGTSVMTYPHIAKEHLAEAMKRILDVRRPKIVKMNNDYATGGISTIAHEFFTGSKSSTDLSGVFFNEYNTLEDEVNGAVENIKALVKAGYDPSDIILTSEDLTRYIDYIDKAFTKNEIFYNYHERMNLSDTDIFSLIDIINDVAIHDKIAGSHILRLIQLPFVKVTNEERIAVTRFIKRFGDDISIAHDNSSKFNGKKEHILASALTVRLMNILNPVKNTIIDGKVTDVIAEIYKLFDILGINTYYQGVACEFQDQGNTQKALFIVKTWEKTVSGLGYIDCIYGERQSSCDLFSQVFRRVFRDICVTDNEEYYGQITVTPISSAKNRRNKVTLVLGANENYFPAKLKSTMFSNHTMILLNKNSFMPTLLSEHDRYAMAIGDIYMTMIKPTDRLYISWANTDENGLPMHPAVCIRNILKDKSKINYNSGMSDEERFLRLASDLSKYRLTGNKSDTLDDDFQRFSEDELYSSRLSDIVKNCVSDYSRINASKDLILAAYKNIDKMAITELESYATCPYSHYIKYGVRPRTVKKFEENSADAGNFYHEILHMFYTRNANKSVKSLDKSFCEQEVENIVSELDSKHNENVLNSSVALKYQKDLMVRQAKKAVWATVQQLQAGDFVVKETEKLIEAEDTLNITVNGNQIKLSGKIDRIDCAEVNGQTVTRVIDYKSGKKKYCDELTKAGIQLQLPLYLASMQGTHAGMYYSTVATAFKDKDTSDDMDLKKYQLSGLTLNDKDIICASDNKLADTEQKSDIINVQTLKSGDISKRSSVTADFNAIETEAVNTATKIAEEILAGNTKAHPWKSNKLNACQYCEFRNMCRFDAMNGDTYRTE